MYWPSDSEVNTSRPWSEISLACLAGGISRASAFVGSEAVNASGEAVRGLLKSRVEFPPAQIRGVFSNYAFASARREFRIAWENWNVNQMLIYTSHLSQGKRFVFIHRFAKWTMRRNAYRISFGFSEYPQGKQRNYTERKNSREPLKSELISRNWCVKRGWLAYRTSKFYGSWQLYICRSLLGHSTFCRFTPLTHSM